MTSKAGYEVKGSLMRGYVTQVERLGILPAVRERVAAETRELIDELPLASTWIDAAVIEDLVHAVEALRGMDAVRVVTKEGQIGSVLPLLRPFVSGVLRLFGGSPLTLLTRFAQLTTNNVRGLEFEWITESEHAGKLSVRFPRPKIPRSAFVGFESGLLNIVELCSKTGKVEETHVSADGSSGVIRVSW